MAPPTETPRHLAERVLASRAALEGERKYITVLFADVKDSLALLADRDLEDARQFLDAVLEQMIEAVHRYEGIISQTLGDGIMALFGAPLALEDHAVRACYAALAMRQSLRAYAEPLRARGINLRVRVGLNSGEVVVRSISSDLRMDYSAIGQTSHLAARMEQMAQADSIYITRSVVRLTDGFISTKLVGTLPVKGLARPMEIYELCGVKQGRTRLQAAVARGLTPLVGRETELEAIAQAQALAYQGRGQVVALVGEPGVGKSRLIWEATRPKRLGPWLLLEAAALPYARTTFRLVVDLLRAYLQVEPDDDHQKILEKLHGNLASLDETLLDLAPAYLSLLDVPVESEAWDVLPAPVRRQRTLEAMLRLLLRESEIQPLLIIADDLHWIDSDSQVFLDSLVEGLAGARVLLVVAHRPAYRHNWSRLSYYTRLPIGPLPTPNTDELLGTLLGPAPELESVRRRLVELTGGNPLFLEECVRALVETGLLTGQRGTYSAVGRLERLEIPPTVQAVLAARIDRLPPVEKNLLQAAAVIGKDVPFVLLHAIADEDDETLLGRLARLREAELLYESQLFPTLEYTFKHAFTHDVAYASLLQERRRTFHLRIMEAIESLHSDRVAEHFERLADHAIGAGAWEKAAQYSRLAGEKAVARSAHREAAQRFVGAIEAVAHLPETRDVLERATDLRFELRKALFPLGEYARALQYLREAEGLALRLEDQLRLGRVAAAQTSPLWWMGQHTLALRTGEQALAAAQTAGDMPLQVEVIFRIGQAHQALGDYRRAIDSFQRAIDTIGETGHGESFGLAILPAVFCQSYLVWCLAELGEFREGADRGAQAIRIAREANHPYSLIAASYCGGRHDLIKGDLATAIPRLEEALALCRLHEIPVWFPGTASALGHAYFLGGRRTEGLALLEQAVERADAMEQVFAHALRLVFLADALLSLGRPKEAETQAVKALETATQHQEAGSVAHAWRALGRVTAEGDVKRAQASYAQAVQLAERLGMRPLLAHCHLGLGQLLTRSGSSDAGQHLHAAEALYAQLDMGFWRAHPNAGP